MVIDEIALEAAAKASYDCCPYSIEGVALEWDSEEILQHPTCQDEHRRMARAAILAYATATKKVADWAQSVLP